MASTLQKQQDQLSTLASRLTVLHDEHEALCSALAVFGVVPEERLDAWLHRRRFAAVVRQHPCASRESLESLAQAREMMFMVAVHAGLVGALSLAGASHAFHGGVAAVLPQIRTFFLSLYAIGGEAGGTALASVECFDTLTGTWAPGIPLQTPRSGCAAVALGERVYVLGGCTADGNDLDSVECFDLRRKVWENLPPMHAGRDELAATVADGHIFAVGGSHLLWPVRHVTDAVECFDPVRGAWEDLRRLGQERCAAAAAVVRGHIYCLGGCDEDGTALDSVERYGLGERGEGWAPAPPMRRPRCNFAAAAVRGSILVTGGYDDRMNDLDAVERFDPSLSGTWELVSSLAVPRWGLRAVGRGDAVFVVGGRAHDGEVGLAGRFDVTSGDWAAVAPLGTARRSFGLAACHGVRAGRGVFEPPEPPGPG